MKKMAHRLEDVGKTIIGGSAKTKGKRGTQSNGWRASFVEDLRKYPSSCTNFWKNMVTGQWDGKPETTKKYGRIWETAFGNKGERVGNNVGERRKKSWSEKKKRPDLSIQTLRKGQTGWTNKKED